MAATAVDPVNPCVWVLGDRGDGGGDERGGLSCTRATEDSKVSHFTEPNPIWALLLPLRFVRETEGGALLHELAAFLAERGYRLHNLYDQVESRARGTIYANALFLGAAEEAALVGRTNDRVLIQRLARVVSPTR